MAARHFATMPDGGSPDAWRERSSAPTGRHFKVEPVLEESPIVSQPLHVFVAPDVESAFHVDVREDDQADATARSRIDQIMRELEEEMQASERLADEVWDMAEPEEGTGEGKAADGVPSTLPPMPAIPGEALIEEEDAPPVDSLDATLVLDRVASALANERPEVKEEYLATAVPKERLEVSTDYVQDLQDISPVMPTSLARHERRRPFGFFARIGEWISRLLHLDEH